MPLRSIYIAQNLAKVESMKSILKFIFILVFYLTSHVTKAAPQMIDGMYVNTFGNSKDPAIIFIHGGPGYNSQDFEITTAEA